MRFDPWMIGLTFAGAAGLAGCGGGSSSSEGDGASPAEGGEARGETHFAVEGRGESAKATTVLDVVEGEEASRLQITGSDGADDLIAIYVTFHGLDTVVGSHELPIGTVEAAEVFAVGSIDGSVYQSESGRLRLSLSSDYHSVGDFEMTLALDAASSPDQPAGEPARPAELALTGTFESEWWVNCRSYISGFTGGHAVSDSPFCLALEF